MQNKRKTERKVNSTMRSGFQIRQKFQKKKNWKVAEGYEDKNNLCAAMTHGRFLR